MRIRPGVTALAVMLTAVAITVPCAAWYFAGSRSARLEAEQSVRLTRFKAMQTATSLAERIAGRLDVILDVESRRPVYQYHHAYHDPNSRCECQSLTLSPLAVGPEEEMVEAHFQIDPAGTLTMPTLAGARNGDAHHGDEWLERQGAIRERLEQSIGAIRRSVERIRAAEASDPSCARPSATQKVSARAQAGSGGGTMLVDVEVPRFTWHVVEIDGDPSLVALREMETPAGLVIQGFIVSAAGVTKSMEGAYLPAEFLPGSARGDLPPDDVIAGVPLDGVNWIVHVNATDAVKRAAGEGNALVRRFRILFTWTTGAAVLAGLFVILLVRQTVRLSMERSQFAAAAAHELRTPLAGMQLYSDMLSQGLGDDAKRGEYAAHIASEARRLGRVVANVLDYSRLERGGFSLNVERGDPGEALDECVAVLRPALESQGASVRLNIEPGLPPVRFDRDAFFHIVQNLLDNAGKFTRRSANRAVEIDLVRTAAGAELRVVDHGSGVSDAMKPRLFRSFERVEGGGGRARSGLGLGLVLVRRLAEAQGGGVRYEETEGGGATFVVTFAT